MLHDTLSVDQATTTYGIEIAAYDVRRSMELKNLFHDATKLPER